MKYTALQRDMQLRSQFVSDVSVYNPDMLIFLDESGLDKRDGMCQYGYSLRGRPPVCQRFLARGTHISLMAFMSTAGVLDCKLMQGGVDGDVFYEFVENSSYHISCHLMDTTRSVVVLDNCANDT